MNFLTKILDPFDIDGFDQSYVMNVLTKVGLIPGAWRKSLRSIDIKV